MSNGKAERFWSAAMMRRRCGVRLSGSTRSLDISFKALEASSNDPPDAITPFSHSMAVKSLSVVILVLITGG